MKGPKRSGWISILEPVRVFVVLLVVVVIYLLPLGEKPEFIERNGRFIEIAQYPAILEPFYPERITASCNGGPGFNCNTGCCRDGQCVKCPEEDPTPVSIRPPTINASLECGSGFVNGWCANSLALNLTASDPHDRAVIISGSINGNDFACPDEATSCSIPITDEGTGSITYRVDSASGASADGATSYNLDFTTPQLDGWLSGVPGSNGWYVSAVDLGASASDSVSGLAAFGLSIDGGSAIPYTDTTFSDGVHTVILSAMDQAGNYSETTLTFNIDTLTPSLNISINGTAGAHGWYTSKVQVTPSANDSGSGVAGIEVSKDGAAYVSYASPLALPNGHHSWQFRVIDNAGNLTESPVQEAYVDGTAPDIQLMQEVSLGETLYYEVQDDGSELTRLQFVIEDEDEEFKKVTWEQDISGDHYDGGVLWDGKFRDGAEAPAGTYSLTIKATDAAGNEARKSGSITVDFFSFLQDIPPFDPPQSPSIPETGSTENAGEAETSPSNEFGGAAADAGGERTTQSFTKHPVGAGQPVLPDPNIAWGVAAAAAVAAFVAEAEKKRKEEAAQKAAAKAAGDAAAFAAKMEKEGQKNDHRILSYKERGEAYQASLDNFNATLEKAEEMGMSAAEVALLKEEVANSGTIGVSLDAAGEFIVKKQIEAAQLEAALQAYHEGERQDATDAALAASQPVMPSGLSPEAQQAFLHSSQAAGWVIANTTQLQEQYVEQKEAAEEQRKAEELQAGLAAYYNAMKQGEQIAEQTTTQTNNWWDKAWDLAYNNQTELSLMTGLVVGVAAVVIGVATAPAWLVIGGAVLVTAVLVTAGTVAINSHFGLDLTNNLGSNLLAGTIAALLTTGAGLLLASAAPIVGATITNTCAQHPAACNQALTVLDFAEEALLSTQIGYYTWIGDQDSAAQATIELQLEQMDGGAPGNSIAIEMSEQLAKLGPQATELINKYGPEAIPLLIKYGSNAVKVLDVVDLSSAAKLLKNLDADALSDLLTLDSKTIAAFSKLPDDVLLKSGEDAVYIAAVYGDNGLTLLNRHGNDAVKLINEYGTPAVNLILTRGDDAVDVINKYGEDVFLALDGGLVKVNTGNVDEFAEDLAKATGQPVWASSSTGMIYVSKSTEDALDASKMLDDAFASGNKDDIAALIEIIAEGSTRGSGDRVVLGAWKAGDGYIGDAVENGGIFFDTGSEVWTQVNNSGIPPWEVNEQFLKNQLESKVGRIDFVGEDIFDVINSPDLNVNTSFRAKEIDWLLKNAEKYGYVRIGNSWVLP
jgi:hypothetical protein